ncbi:MAG TPA: hypothetical protein VJO35_15455 [Terriglobales bacterium]|nr:hypothetical protein [Terriglobales bacterium]
MPCARNVVVVVASFFLLTSIAALGQSSGAKVRDSSALEILNRTIAANGGLSTLSGVQDLSEMGQLTFPSADNSPAPVTIRLAGTSRFRMEADLPEGKTIWVTNDAAGSKQSGEDKRPMVADNAVNLGGLTFPLFYVLSAFQNAATQVRLVGIEQKSGRSVYRIRIEGLSSRRFRIAKDLVIDALTFDILSMSDQPLPMYMSKAKSTAIGPREIDFSDFRSVQGVRVPFLIVTRIHGQPMENISLTQVALNTKVLPQDFEP